MFQLVCFFEGRMFCNEIPLTVHGVITQFQLWCVAGWQPQARRNQLRPDAHNNEYKTPMILLDCEEYGCSWHKTQVLPSETCKLLDQHLWSWVNWGEHADHFLQSIDVEGERDLNSNALVYKIYGYSLTFSLFFGELVWRIVDPWNWFKISCLFWSVKQKSDEYMKMMNFGSFRP